MFEGELLALHSHETTVLHVVQLKFSSLHIRDSKNKRCKVSPCDFNRLIDGGLTGLHGFRAQGMDVEYKWRLKVVVRVLAWRPSLRAPTSPLGASRKETNPFAPKPRLRLSILFRMASP